MSDRYWLILVLYAVASFGVMLVLNETVLSLLRKPLLRFVMRMRARDSVAVLLAIRYTPALIAMLMTLICALPGYLRGEPAGTEEIPGLGLVVLAMIGVSSLLLPVVGTLRILRRTRRATQAWLSTTVATNSFAETPIVEFGTDVPLVAAAGLRNKRIFLSTAVRDLLSARELRAVLRHEVAHCRQNHNLGRLLFELAPRLLFPNWLHDALGEAMEYAADDAVRDVPGDALNLAAAVVLLARESSQEESVLYSMAVGGNAAVLERRVERLFLPRPTLARRMMGPMAFGLAAFVAFTVAVGSLPAAQAAFRESLEFLVR